MQDISPILCRSKSVTSANYQQPGKKKYFNSKIFNLIQIYKKCIIRDLIPPKKVLTLAGIELGSPRLPVCNANHSATRKYFFKIKFYKFKGRTDVRMQVRMYRSSKSATESASCRKSNCALSATSWLPRAEWKSAFASTEHPQTAISTTTSEKTQFKYNFISNKLT